MSHPAATATPKTVVFAEQALVVGVFTQRAIDKLLLRQTRGRVGSLNGDRTFKLSGHGEGPAGAAAALVFDRSHFAASHIRPVDSSGNSDEAAAIVMLTWAENGTVGGVCFMEAGVVGNELRLSQIRELV